MPGVCADCAFSTPGGVYTNNMVNPYRPETDSTAFTCNFFTYGVTVTREKEVKPVGVYVRGDWWCDNWQEKE